MDAPFSSTTARTRLLFSVGVLPLTLISCASSVAVVSRASTRAIAESTENCSRNWLSSCQLRSAATEWVRSPSTSRTRLVPGIPRLRARYGSRPPTASVNSVHSRTGRLQFVKSPGHRRDENEVVVFHLTKHATLSCRFLRAHFFLTGPRSVRSAFPDSPTVLLGWLFPPGRRVRCEGLCHGRAVRQVADTLLSPRRTAESCTMSIAMPPSRRNHQRVSISGLRPTNSSAHPATASNVSWHQSSNSPNDPS